MDFYANNQKVIQNFWQFMDQQEVLLFLRYFKGLIPIFRLKALEK